MRDLILTCSLVCAILAPTFAHGEEEDAPIPTPKKSEETFIESEPPPPPAEHIQDEVEVEDQD